MCTVLSWLCFLCEKTATAGLEEQDSASGARIHVGSTDVKMRRVNGDCVHFGIGEEESGCSINCEKNKI